MKSKRNTDKIYKMNDEKDYEERVKQRVLLLRESIKEGKVSFAEKMRDELEKSFSKVKFDEKGEPIFSTIDGLVRSVALGVEQFEYRNRLREAASLLDIQNRYFEMFEVNFKHFYDMMIEHETTPYGVAHNIVNSDQNLDYLDNAIPDILHSIEEFWEAFSESAYIHIQDQHNSSKAVFGGDLFPSGNENIASKCSLYTDTIILPCPFIRSRHLFPKWTKSQRVSYLIEFSLNILQYKELATTELVKPIIVILPDKEMLSKYAFEEAHKLGQDDGLYHASKIFGRQFENIDDLLDFAENLDTVEKVMKVIKEPNKVLFDTEFTDPLPDQIIKQSKGHTKQLTGVDHPGLIVASTGVGRMGVCNETLMKSIYVGGGTPLINVPTSWEYFKWKMQYDSERKNPGLDYSELHVIAGINSLRNTKLRWLGKIPPKGIIELRKNDSIEEIRNILCKGVKEIITSDNQNFRATTHKVFNNLNEAFKQHQKNIRQLENKKWKVAGKDLGSWLVMGTIEISSACLGTPLYGVSALVLDQFLDAPKLKDLPQTLDKIKKLKSKQETLNKSPIGMMFRYSE